MIWIFASAVLLCAHVEKVSSKGETDVEALFPLSEDESTHHLWRWKQDLSDEFNLNLIDREKWSMSFLGWPGSPPGIHDIANVGQSSGGAIVRAKYDPDNPLLVESSRKAAENHCECAFANYTTGILKTDATIQYGYIEAKLRFPTSTVKGSVWLQSRTSELSVHSVGSTKPLSGTVHCFSQNLPPHISEFKLLNQPGGIGTTYHTVGIKITPSYVQFFTDGILQHELDRILWQETCNHGDHVPYKIMFDVEIDPGVHPTMATFEQQALQIDYIRTWDLNTGCPSSSIGYFNFPRVHHRSSQSGLHVLGELSAGSVTACATFCVSFGLTCKSMEYDVTTTKCYARSNSLETTGVRSAENWLLYERKIFKGTNGFCNQSLAVEADRVVPSTNDHKSFLSTRSQSSTLLTEPVLSTETPIAQNPTTNPCNADALTTRFSGATTETKFKAKFVVNLPIDGIQTGIKMDSVSSCASRCESIVNCTAIEWQTTKSKCFAKQTFRVESTHLISNAAWNIYFRQDFSCHVEDSIVSTKQLASSVEPSNFASASPASDAQTLPTTTTARGTSTLCNTDALTTRFSGATTETKFKAKFVVNLPIDGIQTGIKMDSVRSCASKCESIVNCTAIEWHTTKSKCFAKQTFRVESTHLISDAAWNIYFRQEFDCSTERIAAPSFIHLGTARLKQTNKHKLGKRIKLATLSECKTACNEIPACTFFEFLNGKCDLKQAPTSTGSKPHKKWNLYKKQH